MARGWREASEGGRLRRGNGVPAANPAARAACVREIERAITNEGQQLLGWRDVPVDDSSLGNSARDTMPVIRQAFVGAGRGQLDPRTPSSASSTSSERASATRFVALGLANAHEFYVPSFLAPHHRLQGDAPRRGRWGKFYTDLNDKRFTSALCLAHQRFSTNTFPTWDSRAPVPLSSRTTARSTRCAGNLNWIKSRPGDHPLEAAGRRPRQDLAPHLRRPVRLRVVRQRAGAAR
jgi:glutamate synthase domain-containing protein 1